MKDITRRDLGALMFGSSVATMMASRAPAAGVRTAKPRAIRKRRLGTMQLSLTGLGLAQLGGDGDYANAERIIHAALDSGINFFDTAQIYGPGPDGKFNSEDFLGRALGKRRGQVHISTKFGFLADGMPRRFLGLNPANVEPMVDTSLQRLRTDHIDLYQPHQFDPKVPIAETLGALARVIEKGKIGFIGASRFSPQQLVAADKAARDARIPRFISTQEELNLLQRHALTSIMPTLDQLDMGLIPFFPLANGFLTGKYKPNEAPPAGSAYDRAGPEAAARRLTEKNFRIIQALEAWAIDHGHTMLDLAFSWIAAQPHVVSVIAGASKPEQVVQNAAASAWKMTPAQAAEVANIAASFDSSVLTPGTN